MVAWVACVLARNYALQGRWSEAMEVIANRILLIGREAAWRSGSRFSLAVEEEKQEDEEDEEEEEEGELELEGGVDIGERLRVETSEAWQCHLVIDAARVAKEASRRTRSRRCSS